jgi:hypothetical protein
MALSLQKEMHMALGANSEFIGIATTDETRTQRQLAQLNRLRLTPHISAEQWPDSLERELELRRLEYKFVERERGLVRARAQTAPQNADAFVQWFEALKQTGPGQGDPLFPWLAQQATRAEMCWFLQQEMAGEAGFDDLVALTQVKLPARPKLELARNYWDEMGQGTQSGMHGPMLEKLSHALSLDVREESTVWESLALANLMVALAANRHYAYQSVGALGAIELTAPGRSEQVNAGLKRLDLPGEARRYYALHATLDVKHSRAWNAEALQPLVAANPELAVPIAEGALMRLRAGERCFERYRNALWTAR